MVLVYYWWRVRERFEGYGLGSNAVSSVGGSGRFWYRYGVFWRPYMDGRASGMKFGEILEDECLDDLDSG